MMHTHIWRSEDALLLRGLRQEAKMDDLVFARLNAISLTQLRELEGQGEGSFYNAQIKANTGIKLLKKLGHSFVPPEPLRQETVDLPMQAPIHATITRPWMRAAPATTESTDKKTSSFFMPQFKGSALSTAPKWGGALLVSGLLLWVFSPMRWTESSPASGSNAYNAAPKTTLNLMRVADHGPALNKGPDAVSKSAATTLQLPLASATDSLKNDWPARHAAPQEKSSSRACDASQIQGSPIHEAANPIKAGNYVHFVAAQDTALCVRDHHNQLTNLQLAAGSARSVYGAAPFLVHSANWPAVQVFFQGRRMADTAEGSAHRIFKSKEISAQ